MSHYAVAVFTKEPDGALVEDLLEPYSENLRVDRYVSMTVEDIIKDKRKDLKYIQGEYDKYLADPEKFEEENGKRRTDYFKNDVPGMLNSSDAELYEQFIAGTPNLSELDPDDEREAVDDDGNLTSTYNPDSKWDWYVLGGRFEHCLPLKEPQDGKDYVTDACVSEIKWGTDEEIADYIKVHPEIRKEYEEMMEKGDGFYKVEYLRERYPTLESFVRTCTDEFFTPYAALFEDIGWQEPGRMGWFGCSSASAEEESEWHKTFYEKYLKERQDWFVVIVDCHI